MKVHYNEGIANHIVPRAVRYRPRGLWRSVGRGMCRLAGKAAKERKFRMPTSWDMRKATRTGAFIASARSVRRGRGSWHAHKLLVWEPGGLMSGRRHASLWSVLER